MNIQFESSTACNAKCIFCPLYDMTRTKGFMSDDLFHKIIKEGKEMKARVFLPFLNGEPFLFPKIWEWFDYMEREEVKVALYTNAERLDVDRLIKYSNIELVNCSFNGATKETYDKVMRGPDFEKTKKNIENLIKKASFKVTVSFVRVEENVHEIELFKKMWGKNAICNPFINWAGVKHSSLEKKGNKKPCKHLLNHLTILWDGRVALCCMDHEGRVILGDINKQSLSEVWNSFLSLRERHHLLDFDMPLCRDCDFNRLI